MTNVLKNGIENFKKRVRKGDQMLKAGKRYEWGISHEVNGNRTLKNGLFVGEYDDDGDAVFQTKEGEFWAIPEEDVWEYKGRK